MRKLLLTQRYWTRRNGFESGRFQYTPLDWRLVMSS